MEAIGYRATSTAATTLIRKDIARAGFEPALVELLCIKKVLSLLDLAEFFDVLLELLAAGEGAVFDACTVVVDRVDAVVKEFGNLRRVLNAQADEGENAYLGGESVLLFGAHLRFGL